MITKRTDELEPGDVVVFYRGFTRTVESVTTSEHVPDLLRVRYVPLDDVMGTGGWAEPDQEWQVDAPSKLEIAVAQAQKLADQYDTDGVTAREISELFELFKAAR